MPTEVKLENLIGTSPGDDGIFTQAVMARIKVHMNKMPNVAVTTLHREYGFRTHVCEESIKSKSITRQDVEWEEEWVEGGWVHVPKEACYEGWIIRYRGEQFGYYDGYDGYANHCHYVRTMLDSKYPYRCFHMVQGQRFFCLSSENPLMPMLAEAGLPVFSLNDADDGYFFTFRRGEEEWDLMLRLLAAEMQTYGKPVPTKHGPILITTGDN